MRHEIIMPALGMSQDSGQILAWCKNIGDAVAAADVIMEIETDKTTVEVETGADGYVAEILYDAGSDVPVGSVVAVITAQPASASGPAPGLAAKPEPAPQQAARAPASPAAPTPASPGGEKGTGSKILASPKARRLAAERGIDLTELVAAGAAEPLRAGDIPAGTAAQRHPPDGAQSTQPGSLVPRPAASPTVRKLARESGVDLSVLAGCWNVDHAQYGPVTKEPLSRHELLAARNLAASHQMIPAVTHHDLADISHVEELRASLRDEAAARGIKLTVLAFHVAALARVLAELPRFNSSLDPGGETLWLKRYCHIGIAVDTPHGLVIPVIRDADQSGIWQLAARISELAQAARKRKIRPHESAGASMTITSLGAAGGIGFTPIINPPEVAILGVSRTVITPLWRDDHFAPVPMAPLDLSYDHRVINGAAAARFMTRYRELLAEPGRLLL